MLDLKIDETKLEECFLAELKKRLDRLENTRTLWDMKELCRQTSMSENSIKDKFFYDKRFPKHKIGGKWYFPAREAEEFLLMWIKEQPSN